LSKPESTFIASVHRKITGPRPWIEKNHNAYRGGTPDVFYSGDEGCMWVEYKWLDKIPLKALILPALSPLQRDWLAGRKREGRFVAVVVGCPEGGVIYITPKTWNAPLTPAQFRKRLLHRTQIAIWISLEVGARCDISSRPFKAQRSP